MKTEIIINPTYQELERLVCEVPSIFDEQGETIQTRRNIIKSISYDGLDLNLKRYRIPIFINRIAYSFFRKTKAYKAYYNALKLENRGFSTPSPIAFILQKTNKLISYSYFISLQLRDVKEIREFYFSKNKNDLPLLASFAKYTAQLHEANIIHLDYSPGNILISRNGEGYNFSLVDINRMKFCQVDIEQGCENFCRLFEYDEISIFVASEYAKARNLDVDKCIERVLFYKHRFENKKRRKKKLKQFLNFC